MKKIMRFPLFTGLLLSFLTARSVNAAFEYRKILLSDEPVPGLPAGHTIRTLSEFPTLNDAGVMAFGGTLTVGGTITDSNDAVLFSGKLDALQLIAREGNPAPGTPVQFRSFSAPAWTDLSGRTTFRAFLQGDGIDSSNNLGWWNGNAGSLLKLWRLKDPVPGLTDVFFYDHGAALISRGGRISFDAELTGPGLSSGAVIDGLANWTGYPETMGIAFRAGQQAPGTNLVFHQAQPAWLGDDGTVILSSSLITVGQTLISWAQDSYFWKGAAGNLQIIGRPGQPMEGFPEGWKLSGTTTQFVTGSDGAAVFAAGFYNSSGGGTGLFRYTNGTAGFLVREGEPAPVVRPGEPTQGGRLDVFETCEPLAITQNGSLLMKSTLAYFPQRASIWRITQSEKTLLWLEGTQAPGLPEGTFFGPPSTSPGDRLSASAAGVLFTNRLTGPAVTTADDHSLWLLGSDGSLNLIAREGQLWEVSPGDLRRVIATFVSSGGNPESNPGPLLNAGSINAQGEFVFYLRFTGSPSTHGVFLASPRSASAGSFKIGSVTRTASTITLSIEIPAGLTGIGVEYSENLSAWEDLGNATVNGSTATFTETDPQRIQNQKGFYRAYAR